MNKELIKFIELCLADDVISDKEKKVIFRKAKELGVPKDECEIILEGLIIKNAQNDKQPTKQSKELPVEKLNNKQEHKVDSRQPVKKDLEDKQKNPEKAKRRFSISAIIIPKVFRVILTIGYFLLNIFWCSVIVESGFYREGVMVGLVLGFVTIGVPIIVAYFIFRLVKLQFEFFYFSICAAGIIIFGMNYDGGSTIFSASDYDISRDVTINRNGVIYFIIDNLWIFLAIFVCYLFLITSSKESEGVNKDIAKFEKKKTENSNKPPTLKMTEKENKIVNKDIEKIENRRGRND